MKHFAGQSALFGYLDKFVHGLDEFLAFAAHVAGIDAAVFCGYFGHLDELRSRGVTARRIDERSGHAHGAILHGGLEDGFHLGEFIRSRLTRVITQYGDARLRLRKVTAEVQADSIFLQSGPVVADLFSRNRCSALAANRGCDSLHQFIFG